MKEMKYRDLGRFTALLTMLTLLSIAAVAQNGKKASGSGKTKPNGVVASFAYCAQGDSACEAANRVRMNINEPYVNGEDGVDAWFNVGVSGDLLINLLTTSRYVTYDFTDVIYYGNPQPDWWFIDPVQTVNAHFNIGNAWAAKEQCGSAATCDEHYITRMNGGGWNTGGGTPTNALQWNPFSAQPYINTPDETSPVDVHYIKNAGDEVFIITPLPNAGGYYLAGLQSSQRKTVTASGQYNMPFTLVARLQ